MNPFAALGLPARPDLTTEEVRAAWRAIAAETHPDRPGGGNVAAYTAAAAAYAQLRTPWGRSEAYADLSEAGEPATDPVPVVPGVVPDMPGLGAPRRSAPAASLAWSALLLPARIRRGRPLRLAVRAVAGALAVLAVLRLVPGQPAGPAAVTGIITWFLLTCRTDLAPPPGR